MKNKAANFYRAFFSSKICEHTEEEIQDIIKMIRTQDSDYDQRDVNAAFYNKNLVEEEIIRTIFDRGKTELNMEYLSLYSKQMNMEAVKIDEDNAVVMDELFIYLSLSFFIMVFSLAYDNSPDNVERCIKNCFVLLDLQGLKREIGVHNQSDIQKMMSVLPINVMNTAVDAYWAAWTFQIGHELYHLEQQDQEASYEEELRADRNGYKILIDMIAIQKSSEMPESIMVYEENIYLAPIMLFEYFRILDVYRGLCKMSIPVYDKHPSPQKRENHILELFDTCVPDDFNTEEGNELLNLFLETVDFLEEQISIKRQLGKLEMRTI